MWTLEGYLIIVISDVDQYTFLSQHHPPHLETKTMYPIESHQNCNILIIHIHIVIGIQNGYALLQYLWWAAAWTSHTLLIVCGMYARSTMYFLTSANGQQTKKLQMEILILKSTYTRNMYPGFVLDKRQSRQYSSINHWTQWSTSSYYQNHNSESVLVEYMIIALMMNPINNNSESCSTIKKQSRQLHPSVLIGLLLKRIHYILTHTSVSSGHIFWFRSTLGVIKCHTFTTFRFVVRWQKLFCPSLIWHSCHEPSVLYNLFMLLMM